jgi:hypothetical protein
MQRALADFGFPSADTSPDYLLSQNKMYSWDAFLLKCTSIWRM